MDKCLNCGEILSGKYCFNCGQKSGLKRYAFSSFVQETFTSFAELDSDFLRTFKALLINPGVFIRNYLLGARINFNSPLKYLVIVLAINFAVTFILNKPAFEPVKIYSDENNQVFNQTITLLTNIVTMFFMLPMALGLMLTNRKESFFFLEYFAFMLYIISHSVFIFIFINLFAKIAGAELSETVRVLTWIILFTIIYFQAYIAFFNGSIKKKIINFILSYAAGLIILVIPIYLIGLALKN